MGIHKLQAATDGGFEDHGIRIEQQHILGIVLTDGLVVSSGEAHILTVGNDVHLRMTGGDDSQGVVGGVVVHHEDVALDTLQSLLHTLQTLVEQLADIVADDDYADFLGHTKGMQSNRMTPR